MKLRLNYEFIQDLTNGKEYDIEYIMEYPNTSTFKSIRSIKNLLDMDIDSFLNKSKYYEAFLYDDVKAFISVELSDFNIISAYREVIINEILI